MHSATVTGVEQIRVHLSHTPPRVPRRRLAAFNVGVQKIKNFFTLQCISLEVSVYNEGIAIAIRKGAPLASYSIDRRCLQQYMQNLVSKGTGTSVCFTCARKFPHIEGTQRNPIRMYPLLTRVEKQRKNSQLIVNESADALGFLGLCQKDAEDNFGLRQYSQTYGTMNNDVCLPETHEEFDDWHVTVPFEKEHMKMLCCPEDKICTSSGPVHATTACCEHCTAPICKECAACIYDWKPSLPPAALSNDMIIYYAPTILYTENVTVMEMLCASVCITSMICFTLEKKHRGFRSMDECVQQSSHRMAARGNATSFPLPWQDLMQQLHDGASLEKARSKCKPSTHRNRINSCCVNIAKDFSR